jgi:hypothetical protein
MDDYGTYVGGNMQISRPLTREEIDALERDRRAEADLNLLIEAEKIRRDPERLTAALEKRNAMSKELEQIAQRAAR